LFEFLKRRKKKSYEIKTAELNSLMEFLGIDSSSDRLSEVTYFTCLKVLGEGLSKLPLALQKVSEDGGIIDMIHSPLWQTVRVRPNPYMSPSTFWAVMENNRNHWGNSYAIIDRDVFDGSVKLWPVDPVCGRIETETGKDLFELGDITYVYVSPDSGKMYRIPSDNVLHFKSSTVFAGLVGLSVREKLKLSLDGAVMSQEMLNNLYKNHFVPKAAVQFDTGAMVNEDYESEYIRTLQDYADGKGTGGSTFIPLAPGTTIIPLNIKLTDGQFLELRKYTALQIAAAFGIKPNHLNDYERSSYANSETQQLAFYTDTMLYILKQYEEELNCKLLSQAQRNKGFRFKFNIAAVLRGDTKSQLESLSMGVSNGVYTPNEARRNLDLPALPGGDRIYFNGSNIAVEDAGIQYREQEQSDNEKALIRLAESIEKAVECGIIDLRKGGNSDVDFIQNPSTGRMEGSRPGGGSGGSSSSVGSHSEKQRLQEMIKNGDVTLNINEAIQNRHYKDTKEYNDFLKNGVEKSYFTVSQSELQDFLYKNATKGKIFISSAGDVKERFDFEKPVAFDTVLKRETTWATVSYSKKRTHFSPYSPMPKE
jgi:HK97 family phage portal protein